MACAPRLSPPVRQATSLLKHIFRPNPQRLQALFQAVANNVTEIIIDIASNDENDSVKTRLHSVMVRVVDDELTARSNRPQLFDPCAVPRTNPGGQNDECSCHILLLLPR